jgi:hypothetical protein
MTRPGSALLAAAALALILPAACGGGNPASTDSAAVDGGVDGFVRCLYVDDGGVTHGCLGGSMGPGDRDDGGGAPPPPPPNVSPDAMNLPFGAECLDNAQCASSLCYDYRVKGQFCSQLCDPSTPCPAASLGCSGQGVCRVGD